jgi:hypothetical protein
LDAYPAGNEELDEIRSFVWSVVGDLHDVYGAPNAARRAYERALRSARRSRMKCYALTEIARMYDHIGERRLAVQFAHRALEFNDADTESSPAEILSHAAPMFRHGDPVWLVAELLARGHHWKALRVANGVRGTKGRLLRAQCFGSMDGIHEVVEQLGHVAQRHRLPRLGSDDYFYIPRAAFAAVGWELDIPQV